MKVSNFSLAIMIPCSFPAVSPSFFYSFALMDKPSYTLIHADNGGIDALRNNCVEKALAERCTHGLFMDVDQVYPVDTIPKLMAHKQPIVVAKTPRRYPPFDPIMLMLTNDGYQPMGIGDYTPGELVSVDAAGTGCVLYDLEIFREWNRMAQKEIDEFNALCPSDGELSLLSKETRKYLIGLQARCVHPHRLNEWFRLQKHPETGMIIGEDVGFCQDLKAMGHKIYVDTSIDIIHLATIGVNDAMHKLWCAMKIAKEKKAEALGFIETC